MKEERQGSEMSFCVCSAVELQVLLLLVFLGKGMHTFPTALVSLSHGLCIVAPLSFYRQPRSKPAFSGYKIGLRVPPTMHCVPRMSHSFRVPCDICIYLSATKELKNQENEFSVSSSVCSVQTLNQMCVAEVSLGNINQQQFKYSWLGISIGPMYGY